MPDKVDTTSLIPTIDEPIAIGAHEDEPVALPLKAFLRHAVVLGSSGSGKTVACKILVEEFALRGIPVIAIDPQGDIASLALAGSPKELKKHGVDPAYAERFHEEVEVVVFTPASSIGVPLCLTPLTFSFSEKAEARIHEITMAAKSLSGLLGYDLKRTDGRFASAFLDLVITYLADHAMAPKDFDAFADFIEAMPASLERRAGSIMKESQLEDLVRKVRTLGIGARKLLFNHGLPLDIDTLLGREPLLDDDDEEEKEKEEEDDADAAAKEGEEASKGEGEDDDVDAEARPKRKTRISVIYLNTLSTQDQKDYFLAELSLNLYRWILDHPSKDVQALFYVDEIAPFLPPVRKPACKETLKLLYKQARKYGLACLMATQNPGDLDYKAVSQFWTWLLGRLLTNQDIDKVSKIIKSLDPKGLDRITKMLPKLGPGHFLVLSPDNFDKTQPLTTRWLYTQHKTLDDDAIFDLVTDEQRNLFEARGLDIRRGRIDQQAGLTDEPEPITGPTKPNPAPETDHVDDDDIAADVAEIARETIASARSREEARHAEVDAMLAFMRQLPEHYSADTLAEHLELSERRVREILKILTDRDQVRRFRIGPRHRFIASEFTYHKKLGVLEKLPTAPIRVTEIKAEQVAAGFAEREFFIIQKEEVGARRLLYFPLWRCNYEGMKKDLSTWFRTIRRVDNIYFHPTRGEVCLISSSGGFEFVPAPRPSNPLDIKDLDDITHFEHGTARGIDLLEWTLDRLMTEDDVRQQFRRKFNLTAQRVDLVFIPVWEFTLKHVERPSTRPILVDAILGKHLEVRA